ncbi:hypothetical protein [Rhodobacteraceae phage LS06-2018-MD06]|nr:hypothetical protein [Rhodobacteraceae phage LS06-2018-MD06]
MVLGRGFWPASKTLAAATKTSTPPIVVFSKKIFHAKLTMTIFA